ncbi:hypothetical protein CC78DRAFT_538696 [Lojkania enalia]|uniref:Altered inheritance of mitochondria protein 11 n=1 Tax=Lojkania enalia TaxID=147567 RepID=A0A9P4NCZ1_9PLEO|nr:hypothetical protein CC78DRAFT_538696 [Didymosphaeria enalia]
MFIKIEVVSAQGRGLGSRHGLSTWALDMGYQFFIGCTTVYGRLVMAGRLMEVFQKLPLLWTMTRPTVIPANAHPRSLPEPAHESTPITSPRSLRQLSIFFFGATCFLASTAITRRAIYRRKLRISPKFYEPNTNPHEHFSPMMDAVQALNMATINVFSFGIMAAGGTLWAFDISGLKEMQTALRGRLGYDSFDRRHLDSLAHPDKPSNSAIAMNGKEASESDKPRKTPR